MARPGTALGPEAPVSAEIRCDCGSLLAKLVGTRIELKCRRCRRVVGVARVTRIDERHLARRCRGAEV